MKYFTSEWWASGCDDNLVIEKYHEYYLSILSKLPSELRILEEAHTLHDANVKSIHTNAVSKEVTIHLKGWDREFNNQVNYEICFVDIISFDQILAEEDCELGDLGCSEYEVIDNNIEMRMLFSSGAQFRVIFKGFRFEHTKL